MARVGKNVIILTSRRDVFGRDFAKGVELSRISRRRFTRRCMNELELDIVSRSPFFLRLHFISRIHVWTVPLDLASRITNYIEEFALWREKF